MPLAHAGHYASSVLFVLGPFLLFALALAVGWIRGRRQDKLLPRRPPVAPGGERTTKRGRRGTGRPRTPGGGGAP